MNKKRTLLIALMLAIIGSYKNVYAQQGIYMDDVSANFTENPIIQLQKVRFLEASIFSHNNKAKSTAVSTVNVTQDLASSINFLINESNNQKIIKQ